MVGVPGHRGQRWLHGGSRDGKQAVGVGALGVGPPRPEFAGSTADRPATSGSAWVPVSSTKKECTTRQVLVPMYTAPTA